MIVRVLGSAAGGGVPQWNCACSNCAAARSGRIPRRTQSSYAVSADGDRWLLINCSPDIAAQIEAFTPLQPRAIRGTPIAGMLFTDANVDHIGGLAVLRQSGNHRFVVRSSDVVREIATAQAAFEPFAQPPHRWLATAPDGICAPENASDLVGTKLTVRAFPLPGTTPGYDGRRRIPGAVTGFTVAEAGSSPSVVFAPVYADVSDALRRAIASASAAFVDGSFFTDGELAAAHMADKSAASLGHLPVGGEDGSLARLRGSARLIFTHVNNSNPLLDPTSAAHREVRDAGAEVAWDGMELHL
jgi:pyrroloquinoline quinone biosynthesis protein B